MPTLAMSLRVGTSPSKSAPWKSSGSDSRVPRLACFPCTRASHGSLPSQRPQERIQASCRPKRSQISKRTWVLSSAGEDNGASAATSKETAGPKLTILVPGASGYIGRFVAKQLIERGHDVYVFCRSKSGTGGKNSESDTKNDDALQGAKFIFGEATNIDDVKKAFEQVGRVDAVVSCLASRGGGKKDSWDVDYGASKNFLDAGLSQAGLDNPEAFHYVLLSAICVQKPLLEFQKAKLELEKKIEESGARYSIVRPTAFFKSLAAQVQSIKAGSPYIMFGDGKICASKPISETDLANYMANCLWEEDKFNQILPIGGPGPAYTPYEQGQLLFKLLNREESFIGVPVALFDGIIGLIDALAKLFPNLEDAAEFSRIGKYYAVESMLVYDAPKDYYDADATPEFGETTLEMFFKSALEDGGMKGQELGAAAISGTETFGKIAEGIKKLQKNLMDSK